MKKRFQKRQVRSQRRARPETKLMVMIGIISVVVLALAAAYITWSGNSQAAPLFAYAAEDVVEEQPFTAVHEMGQGPEIPFLAADGPQPKIVVSEHFYDFGRIGARDIVQQTFAIRNDGDAPLTISRAYTTCGCTVADFTASAIPPGKVAEVTLIFDAGFHDSRGQTVRRGLIIENNDPTRPQVEIWTQAAVGWN